MESRPPLPESGASQRYLALPAPACCRRRPGPCHFFSNALSGGECSFVNMSGSALSLGFGFMFHVTETVIFACFAAVSVADAQGLFPRLENVGAFKPVSAGPSPATCGLPARSTFCHSSAAAESLQFCSQRVCIQDCPHRASPATYVALLSASLGRCVTADRRDLRPNSPGNATSFIFRNHKSCSSSPPPARLAASFTLAVWLKPEREGVM